MRFKKKCLLVVVTGFCLTMLTGCGTLFPAKWISFGGVRYEREREYQIGPVKTDRKVKKRDVSWIGGNVEIKAEDRESLEVDTTSGAVAGKLTGLTKAVRVKTVSGPIRLKFLGEPDAAVRFHTVSKKSKIRF